MEEKKLSAIEKMREFEKFGSVLGLERMTVLLDLLGNPQEQLKVIHVAGTNGKGSVCKYLYEALRENGYKVGLYISPFIEIFNERIEFDGQYISNDELDRYTDLVLEKANEMVKHGYDSPTEFEVITAVAFLYFSQKPTDFVILEVGLGGRGDSTNVITKPLASVITSISYDHVDRLGNTLQEIAHEKAGIIKEGVPVICNVKDREAAKEIARVAYEKNSILYDVTKIKYRNIDTNIDGYAFDTNIYGTDYSNLQISMDGIHQIENVITAVTTLEILRQSRTIQVERKRLYSGLKKARQKGRFEILSEMPYTILDGAHNVAGAEALANTIDTHFRGKKILMVIGVLADKDVSGVLKYFASITDDFIVTEPDNPRRLEATELCGKLLEMGKNCKAINDYKLAIEYATGKQKQEGYDLVLYAGSLYLIGAVRKELVKAQ